MPLIRRLRERLTGVPPPPMPSGGMSPEKPAAPTAGRTSDSTYSAGNNAAVPLVLRPFEPLRIENRVAEGLSSLKGALNSYFYGLQAGAPRSATYRVQERSHAEAIVKALSKLEERGHTPGSGKAMVLAGGYGVDLEPLLRNFERVHVVDLSDEALARVALDPRYLHYRDRLALTQADISGVDPAWLKPALERMSRLSPDDAFASEMLPFLRGVADHLAPLPLEGAFDLVVSPMATDVLIYGPATVAAQRVGGELDSFLGDATPSTPEAIEAFEAQLDHHGEELKRLLAPGGVVVYSASVRPTPNDSSDGEQLLSVGFGRIRPDDWNSFLDSWSQRETVIDARPLPADHKESMSVYLLEP